jgi:hypothetical protein
MASLEFVMGVPFILFLGAAVLVTAQAGLERSKSAVKARHQAWKMRDAEVSFEGFTRKDDEVLFMAADADSGGVSGTTTSSFKTYSFLGGNRSAYSKSAVLAGTWDHRQITTFETDPGRLHIRPVLDIMIPDELRALKGVIEPAIQATAAILTMNLANMLPPDAKDAKKQADDKKKEADKKAAENKAKKAKAEAELAKLKKDLGVLEDEKTEIIGRRNKAEGELAELIAQKNAIMPPNTVPQSLLNAITAKQNELKAINDELTDKNKQIGKKKAEITEKQKEVDLWNKRQGEADDELGKLPGG